MRHCVRTLLTFTRPYFGTASSMSKTFAVSMYSGGSSRSVWIEQRPLLRSRLSWARRVRTILARSSASRRWVNDRSGAAECFVGVLVAGGIGTRRYYILTSASQAKSRLFPRIHVDLDLRFRCVHTSRRCFPILQGFKFPTYATSYSRIAEVRGPDRNDHWTSREQIRGVRGTRDAPQSDDRNRYLAGDGGDLRQGHG